MIDAAMTRVEANLAIITGGLGVGKTTLVN
jgi:predicted ATPase